MRPCARRFSTGISGFQSTHSLRSATRGSGKLRDLFEFQSTHSLRSATSVFRFFAARYPVSIHALLAECDRLGKLFHSRIGGFNPRTPCGVRLDVGPMRLAGKSFNPRTPCGVRRYLRPEKPSTYRFQSTHSLRSATFHAGKRPAEIARFNPRTPCGVRHDGAGHVFRFFQFQSTHSLRSATAPNLIHCYSTKQIILCANLPKKTVIARLLFLSIYLSIFYSQCITPIADLPGNSCELEVGAQAMFNSL